VSRKLASPKEWNSGEEDEGIWIQGDEQAEKEGSKEGRKKGRKKERRKEGKKEGRKEEGLTSNDLAGPGGGYEETTHSRQEKF
jgi:hypothetical protein